jgi:type IV secretion system protein VirB8
MSREPELDSYLKEASTWETDKLRDAIKERTFLRWLVLALITVVACMAWAIKGLTPLKTSEPYVIRVDSSTGIADVVPIYKGEAEVTELVTRHLLTHYQTVRERYFYATAETDYETVGAFNSSELNAEWSEYWQEANPMSPLVLYKDGTTITTHIKGITFLKPESGATDMAQVRFTTEKRKGGSGTPQVTHWVSTIKYVYAAPSKNDKIRGMNPMGLRILSYNKEPEVIADAPQAQPQGAKNEQFCPLPFIVRRSINVSVEHNKLRRNHTETRSYRPTG